MEHAENEHDLLLDRRYPHRQRMTSRQIDDTSFTSFESMLRMLNSLTSPNFLIGFTICVILIFQFRGSYSTVIATRHCVLYCFQWFDHDHVCFSLHPPFYYHHYFNAEPILGWLSERGFLDIFLDIWETIAFYLRTVWNMLNVFLSVPDNNNGGGGGLQQNQPTTTTTTRRGRHAAMPALEEPIRNGHHTPVLLEATTSGNGNDNDKTTHVVEPAFLDPKQYPPGWLVYDPKLGVVPREYIANQ